MCVECTCPAPAPVPSLRVMPNQNQAPISIPPITTKSTTPSITDPLVPWDDLDVGVVVKIKGKPGQFRDVKQIEMVKAEVIRCTQEEVRCWEEVGKFRREVLDVPWVVGEEDEERLRRKAVRERQFSRRKRVESEEERKRRKEAERERKGEESRKRKEGKVKRELEESKKTKRETEANGLNGKNKVNYPSLAARKLAAEKVKGKFDALGI